LYNFVIIKKVSIYRAKFFLDIGGELRKMHFIPSYCMTYQVTNTCFSLKKNFYMTNTG